MSTPVRQLSDTDRDRWIAISVSTPRRAIWRIVRSSALGLIALAGATQLWAIGLWSIRTGTSWALVPFLFHALVIGIALGIPLRSIALTEESTKFAHRLRARYVARRARLTALRAVLSFECIVLIATPPIRTLLTGAQLQWGVTVVIAVCCLLIVWPLSILAAAEQRAIAREP